MGQFSVEIWPVAGSVLSGTQHQDVYFRQNSLLLESRERLLRSAESSDATRAATRPRPGAYASGQLARDAMTGIAERAIVKLLVEPTPCLGLQVTAGDIKKLAHHGTAPDPPPAALIEVGWQSPG